MLGIDNNNTYNDNVADSFVILSKAKYLFHSQLTKLVFS